jgi:ferritin-like protein
VYGISVCSATGIVVNQRGNSMSAYHEPAEELDPKTRDISRAINSLKEELEAVDWYNQRVATTKDAALKKIMAHNRDEEIEHACMTLEWLRRNMDKWDHELRSYLFTEGDVTELEEGASGDAPEESTVSSGSAGGRGLGIGKL